MVTVVCRLDTDDAMEESAVDLACLSSKSRPDVIFARVAPVGSVCPIRVEDRISRAVTSAASADARAICSSSN